MPLGRIKGRPSVRVKQLHYPQGTFEYSTPYSSDYSPAQWGHLKAKSTISTYLRADWWLQIYATTAFTLLYRSRLKLHTASYMVSPEFETKFFINFGSP